MGNDLRNDRRSRGSGSGRNQSNNAKRLDKLKKDRPKFDLSRLDSDLMLAAIGRAALRGGALRIGLTRDGGALAVGVYGDGEYTTVYMNEFEDQTDFWETIMFYFE